LFEHHDGTDPWNEWYGQCDSFAAWKVYENIAGSAAQHPPFRPDEGWAPNNAPVSPVIGTASGSPANNWGDAKDWGPAAQAAHFVVDSNPAPGAIAWWAASPDMPFGHVGYVTDVYPDGTIRIEQYNLRLNGEYSTIVMDMGGAIDTSFGYAPWNVPWPTGFIHIHDGSVGPPVSYPTPSAYPSGAYGPGSGSGFSVNGAPYPGSNLGWYTRPGHGMIGQELWTNTNGATPSSSATWLPPGLQPNQCYAVSAFIPDNYADNPTTHYTIAGASGPYTMIIDQEAYTNAWARLGVFKTDGSGHLSVVVSDIGTPGYYVAADAMQFVPASCQDQSAGGLIIDPSTGAPQFTLHGAPYPGSTLGWYTRSGHGLNGDEQWTNTNGSTESSYAAWRPSTLTPGACYDVSAYIPDNYANNPSTRYLVYGASGPNTPTTVIVNQEAYTNTWADLGTFHADGYGGLAVEVTDIGDTGYYVAADAVQFTRAATCAGPVNGTAYPAGVYGPGMPQFLTESWWATQPGHGLLGQEQWTHTNGSTADSRAYWTPQLVPGACYAVSAYIPDNYANNPQTSYTIHAADGAHTYLINQQGYTNAYAPLGTYQAASDGSLQVVVDDTGPTGYYVAADAMRYVQAPCTSQTGGGYPAGIFGPGSPQFSTTSVWYTDPGHGLNGTMLWTHTNGSTADYTATWTPTLQGNTCYTVSVYVPDNYSDNPAATYYVWSNTVNPFRPSVHYVNENNYTNAWATLGNIITFSDGSVTVELTDQGTPGEYVAADAVRFDRC
jgi:surface antigen